jgi:putative membrane protein
MVAACYSAVIRSILVAIAPSFYTIGAAAAAAHQGPPPAPGALWGAWSPDPLVVVSLLLAAGVYGRGVASVWRRSGRGRVVTTGEVAAFVAGLAAVAVALVSPLDALATALFAAHMGQHLLLTAVAAPLLVLGAGRLVLSRGLPPAARRALGRWECRLVGRRSRRARVGLLAAAVLVFAATFWSWHAPGLYQAALTSPWVHALEHLTMLTSALVLWAAVVVVARRGAVLAAVVALFAASAQEVALAGLVTLAPSAWYGAYAEPAAAWGLSPLADQQLAGALMWTLGGLAYLIGITVLLFRRLDVDRDRVPVGLAPDG